ncbi:uncharacterized protein LOC101862463 [Aplysia californica]|uniref:Uncharacterized protein LOC101862463 n=1 Tax=Aplysia californica TaxID=6500 RepID=A0ABM1ACX5_APLCA|nr:uncharacterized protein LOC101862463 [Aplysia californica]
MCLVISLFPPFFPLDSPASLDATMVLSSSQMIALSLLTIGSLACIAGVISPNWEYQVIRDPMGPDDDIQLGLFYGCATVHSLQIDGCKILGWDLSKEIGDDTFFKAVRVTMCGSILFMLTSTMVGLALCFRRHNATSIMFPAIISTLAGIIGMAGVTTFAICSDGKFNPFEQGLGEDFELSLTKGWSFYLSACGSGFVFLAGLLAMCAPGREGKYVITPTTTTTCGRYGGLANPVFYSKDPAQAEKS